MLSQRPIKPPFSSILLFSGVSFGGFRGEGGSGRTGFFNEEEDRLNGECLGIAGELSGAGEGLPEVGTPSAGACGSRGTQSWWRSGSSSAVCGARRNQDGKN